MVDKYYNGIFEDELVSEIYAKGKVINLKEGDVALDVGQVIRMIPLVVSGALKVLRQDEEGNELLLYYVSAYESCAMTLTCCMQQLTSEIKAVADDNVELVLIPVTVMDEWMMTYPSWKRFVMQNIHSRLNELLKTIDQIAFQNLDDRLVHYLREKSRVSGSSLVNLSHEQIAQELATSRVVVSRLLKKLENQNKLLLYRNQIKLLREM